MPLSLADLAGSVESDAGAPRMRLPRELGIPGMPNARDPIRHLIENNGALNVSKMLWGLGLGAVNLYGYLHGGIPGPFEPIGNWGAVSTGALLAGAAGGIGYAFVRVGWEQHRDDYRQRRAEDALLRLELLILSSGAPASVTHHGDRSSPRGYTLRTGRALIEAFLAWSTSPAGRSSWMRAFAVEEWKQWDREFTAALRDLYDNAPRRENDVVIQSARPDPRRGPTMLRYLAAVALRDAFGAPGDRGELLNLLGDSSELVRAAAAETLRRIPPEHAHAVIRSAVASRSTAARTAAATALVGRRDPGQPALVRELLRSPHTHVRALAAYSLAFLPETGDVAEALRAALGDRDRTVRWHAAVALQQQRTETSAPVLMEALDRERDPAVKEALELAVEIRAEGAVEPWQSRTRAFGLRPCDDVLGDIAARR